MLSTPRAERTLMDREKLDELLECAICLDTLAEDSKVLPCQHTFCHQCLKEEVKRTGGKLKCPECMVLVTIPLDKLPSNILLKRLLEGLKNHKIMVDDKPQPEKSTKSVGLTWSSSKANTPLPLQRVTPTPKQQPWATAKHTYEGTEKGDLSFKKNDVILLRAAVDENWYQGEISGKIGIFPIAYVEVAVPLQENLPKTKALFNFDGSDASDKNCLRFKKDQILTVIRRIDENWAEGMIGEKVGIFPIVFVDQNDAVRRLLMNKDTTSKPVINDLNHEHKISNLAPQLSLDSSTSCTASNACDLPRNVVRRRASKSTDQTSHSPPQVARRSSYGADYANSSKRYSLDVSSLSSCSPAAYNRLSAEFPSSSAGSTQSMNAESSGSACSVTVPVMPRSAGHSPLVPLMVSPTTPSGHRLGPPPNDPPPPPPTVYSALFNYSPNKEDELELIKGEFYTVVEQCHDGWFKGTSLKTGRIGVFPGNYVQFSSQSPSPKPASPRPPAAPAPLFPPTVSNRSETHMIFPLPGTRPLQSAARTSPQHHVTPPVPGSAAAQDVSTSDAPPPPRPTPPQRPVPPTILPRTSAHADRSTRRNSAPVDRMIQSRPLPPTPSVRLDTVVPAPPPRPEDVPTTHARLKDVFSHVIGVGGDTSTITMETTSTEPKKKSGGFSFKRLKSSSAAKLGSKKIVTLSSGEGGTPRIGHVEPVPLAAPIGTNSGRSSGKGKSSATVAKERYRCLVPYPPQTELELELALGDIVAVHKKRDDGWFKGTLERTGRTGLFPGSFVEPF